MKELKYAAGFLVVKIIVLICCVRFSPAETATSNYKYPVVRTDHAQI